MQFIFKIWGKLLHWHEYLSGQCSLFLARDVHVGSGCRAGYGLRLRAVMSGKILIGSDVSFDRSVDIFAHTGSVVIGQGCHFGKGTVICARESIVVGPDCQIAEHVSIRDQDHRMVPGTPIKESGYITSPITISAGVWIGAGAVITKGISVGESALIGAGAVVTSDVPAGVKVGGVPARPLSSN